MFGRKNQSDEPLTISNGEDGGNIVISLAGRLDTVTSPEFLQKAQALCDGRRVVLDLERLEYISSAGLRAILTLNKSSGCPERLRIVNPSANVRNVFDMSGFDGFLE